MAAAAAKPPQRPRPPLAHHLIAGTTAGVVSTTTLHPLDLIKTRFQVHYGAPSSPLARPKTVDVSVRTGAMRGGVLAAIKDVVGREGLPSLYRGVGAAVLGSGVSWGLYFFFYENAKARWQQAGATLPLPAHLQVGSSVEAGVATVLITNPIWLVKTRLQLQVGDAANPGVRHPDHYKGVADAFRQILAEEGPAGLYRGLGPALGLVAHGVLQFAAYEQYKAAVAARGRPELNHWEPLLAGGVSKVFASTLTYPYQVVKARLQQRPNVVAPAAGGAAAVVEAREAAVAVAKRVWRREGALGFFKGLAPNLIKVVPNSAITFYVYETTLRALRPSA